MHKVAGHTNLRKTSGGTVVNVSSSDYDKYIRQKQLVQEEKDRINALEKDVSDIKGMLKQLLDKI
jgi:ACT domain-containing protein